MMPFRLIPLFALFTGLATVVIGAEKSRLIILADMGNEPDEMQQMVHMLVCSNAFELEGLIAVTGKYLHAGRPDPYKQVLHPELFLELIDAYEQVHANLSRHAAGYPTAEYLRSIVKSGQTGYGIADVGIGRTSEGAQLIMDALDKSDERPLWVVVNAGSNTLAEALYVMRSIRPAAYLRKVVAKLRVYENGAQDNAGAWITSEFADIHWIRSNFQTYAYGGPGPWGVPAGLELGPHQWKPHAYSVEGQVAWTAAHVQNGHGPLGALYPDRIMSSGRLLFMEGGGTIPWMGLVNAGLFDVDQPSWGGWGGRFTREKVPCFWSRHGDIRVDEERIAPFYTYREVSDVWTDPADGLTYEGDLVPVWRFRPAMYADFRARMDWCVKPFEEANHHPVAAVDGDFTDSIIRLSAHPGQELSFDASASTDPDGNGLEFHWWIYPEAGTYAGQILLRGTHSPVVSLRLPSGARGNQIHLILEVSDDHPEVPLTDYRRIVIDVSAFEPWHVSPENSQPERFRLFPGKR